MGNSGSFSSGRRSRRRSTSSRRHPAAPPLPPPPPPQPQQPEVAGNRYVFAAATPYPNPNPNPNPNPYYQSPGYYPPPPLPAPLDHHHQHAPLNVPFLVEHQKAITIRNDVNIKKETLRVEPDEQNPGRFLVAFTFDANFAGRITIFFFAKEDYDCKLKSTKDLLLPVTVHFKEGLAQEFRQPPGTGIDFTKFEDGDLVSEGEMEVYPLAVKAEALPDDTQGAVDKPGTPNLQITQAVFEKEKNGNYHVRVVKQILWVNERRYELQEIYGIGNSIEGDFGNDPGKECVICLSEPRDTAVLPCRHMCLCGECATVLRLQTNRCPICRQPVERLLEIKVSEEESPEDAKLDAIPSRG